MYLAQMETINSFEESRNLQNHLQTEFSEIQQYFAGTTIFITGGTGFLGKVLVEKLLRTCYNLTKLYILVRPKRNKSPQQRYKEYFNDPLYDRLKKEQPKSLQKLAIISGDCELPNLGMSDKDLQIIISEVHCIFHVAATVRFNEKLQTAAYINVKATNDILNITKKIQNLKSLVHVSTAYSFCPRAEIDEVFYQPGMKAEKLLTIVDAVDEKELTAMTPILLKEWPNTYTFTKAIAEDLVRRKGSDLPVAVVRPSIVMLTAKDPFPGWIDNYFGATGLFTGVSLGVVRTICYEAECVSDQVPADYVVSNIIAAAWNVGTNRNAISSEEICNERNIPIYNCVSGAQNPITWGQCNTYGKKHVKNFPSMHMQWHYFLRRTSSRFMFLFFHYILHLFPAYILDFLLIVSGNKDRMVKTYSKIKDVVETLIYFTTKTWTFQNENTQALWKKLKQKDKELFEFNIALLEWDSFYATFMYGTRVYLLKDPLETLPKAKTKALKLKVAHYVLVLAFTYIILRISMYLLNVLMGTIF